MTFLDCFTSPDLVFFAGVGAMALLCLAGRIALRFAQLREARQWQSEHDTIKHGGNVRRGRNGKRLPH